MSTKLEEWRKLADRAWYDPCDQFQYAQKFGVALREACDRIEELEARLAMMAGYIAGLEACEWRRLCKLPPWDALIPMLTIRKIARDHGVELP